MLIEKHKTTDPNVPVRQYPKFLVRGGLKIVNLIQGKATIPNEWGYYQYLMLVIYPIVLGQSFVNDAENSSVVRRLYHEIIQKNTSAPRDRMYKLDNADAYLLCIASDLELLYMHDKIPPKHVKDLKSANDGAMRGTIYELTCAAGFIRSGYELNWLTEDSRPEFTASKGQNSIDIEAKRRHRSHSAEYDLEREIRALRKNLSKALKKKRDNAYIVFIDTDLPPASSNNYRSIFERVIEEFKDYELNKTAIVFTHNGFEHDAHSIDEGKTSTLVFQGQDSPPMEEIKRIITHINAKLPPDIGPDWQI